MQDGGCRLALVKNRPEIEGPTMSDLLSPFSDPEAVEGYAEGPPRFVPGFADLHRMPAILIAERAPADARVLEK